jgi:DMSO/TMAO reductase YedYZ molybdopterin-dependent catalytic subunit
VDSPLELSLDDLKQFAEPVEIVAVNQCSGNSRGYFTPRVSGGQLSNGAMGNARWSGVPLRRVLEKAGVHAGAVQVTFDGLDRPPLNGSPGFVKALAIDHALDGEVKYSFGEWSARFKPSARGPYSLQVRAINRVGESQPMNALWNPAGYMRNVVETTKVSAV